VTENSEQKRFAGFSGLIDIENLEKESRKLLYLGFLFAIIFHALLSLFIVYVNPMDYHRNRVRVEKEEKHIQVYLVAIPPRIKNPFEKWQGPSTVSSHGRAKFSPRSPRGQFTYRSLPGSLNELKLFNGNNNDYRVNTDILIREIVASGILDTIKTYSEPIRFSWPEYSTDLTITRKPKDSSHRISLKEEMLGIEDLDTGKFKGLVVMNDSDERDIKGYIHIPLAVWGTVFSPPESTSRAVEGFVQALKTYSKIIVNTDKQVYLSSHELLKYPFVYIAADDVFDLSEEEITNFAAFLRNGGFALIESYGGTRSDLPPKGAASLKQMLRDALGSAGSLHPIPNDHFLYHCYYDFDDGPPYLIREQTLNVALQPASILEGVWIGDRLAAIYSEKKYGETLGKIATVQSFQKFGVNMVVFALVQYGGSTFKLIDDSAR